MQAAYTLVDDATLDRLVTLPAAEVSPAVQALEEAGAQTDYLDKTWDGLHMLLTGVSAGTPIEGDPLSEAVVGVHVFDADDFIGCTEADELPAIIAALDAFDLGGVLGRADFAAYVAAGITPNIWRDDPLMLRAELRDAFDTLRDVHARALAAGRHIVVTIL